MSPSFDFGSCLFADGRDANIEHLYQLRISCFVTYYEIDVKWSYLSAPGVPFTPGINFDPSMNE